MRMSCLITMLNPMIDVISPATLTQSRSLIFAGAPAVILEKGRATFTEFPPLCGLLLSLCNTTLRTGRSLRAGAAPLSDIPQPPHQPGGQYGYCLCALSCRSAAWDRLSPRA
jgi:hypothetical protein